HTRFSRDWSSDVCSSDLIMYNITLRVGAHKVFNPFAGDAGVVTLQGFQFKFRDCVQSPDAGIGAVELFQGSKLFEGIESHDLGRSEERRVGVGWRSP